MGLELLSPAWLDRQRQLDQDGPEVPGASGRFQHVVALGRKEEVAYVTTIVDGRITTNELGTDPDAGEPWQVAKVYYSVWSRKRMEETHAAFQEHGLESPFTEDWFKRESQDHRITTTIDVDGTYEVRTAALRSHATQIDPTSPFWFGLPEDVAATIHPYEDYILAASTVESPLPETDLFAGIS